MNNNQPETIHSLAAKYGVCRQTFSKWIRPFLAELDLQPGTRVLTPLQVSIIKSKLDPPDEE